MIDLFDEDGRGRRGPACASPRAGAREPRQGLAARRPSMPDRMIDGRDGASLKPRFFERMTDGDLAGLADGPEDLEFLQSLGSRSAITVALKARGQAHRRADPRRRLVGPALPARRTLDFAWVLSGRVALRSTTAGLFADLERAERARAEIAETLQRGLLPPPLPHIPGWSVAAIYRPAGAENEVGGDFYDAFRVGRRLDAGDRRRHRPRRPRRLGDRLRPATPCAPPRR